MADETTTPDADTYANDDASLNEDELDLSFLDDDEEKDSEE